MMVLCQLLELRIRFIIVKKGDEINSLLNRDKLFAGQSPESFKYKQYMHIHEGLSENELKLN